MLAGPDTLCQLTVNGATCWVAGAWWHTMASASLKCVICHVIHMCDTRILVGCEPDAHLYKRARSGILSGLMRPAKPLSSRAATWLRSSCCSTRAMRGLRVLAPRYC